MQGRYRVSNELGLHARPAGRLAALASKFSSEIEVATQEEWVNAQSVLSLLSLAASAGTEVRVRARGSDADEALAAIAELFE
ncbi:MAG: HPr family phosphocarrier protein, partial [Myxococcales bacterium]|nr:HPr family phosphocarrier protein [Myxococcales bacterium]